MTGCSPLESSETAGEFLRPAADAANWFRCDKHTILASLTFIVRQPDIRRLTVSQSGRPLAEFHLMPGAPASVRSSIVVAATDLVFFAENCTIQIQRAE